MKIHSLIAALCAWLALPAFAADLESVRRFDIKPQTLETALIEFSKQSDLQVIGATATLTDVKTKGVNGTLPSREALKVLLENTPVAFNPIGTHSVQIVPAKGQTSSRAAADDSALRLAQADTAGTATRAAQDTPDPYMSKAIPEILVTGKGEWTLNTGIERTASDAQPYVIFNRETIARSSATTVEQFLRDRLTSVQASSTSAQGTLGTNTSSFNLRGLSSTQTLILIDGHRSVSPNLDGGELQTDLNAIPLGAIERIEVLPTTASGIYGGGATGGVINVVLRREYAGIQTTLAYNGTMDGGGARRRVDVASGFNFSGGRTNLLIAGAYNDGSDLLVGDRNFLQAGRARILANNRGAIYSATASPMLGATTNIRSNNGQPLTLKSQYGSGPVGSLFTSVPYGYAGPASDNGAGLIAGANRYNLDPANTAQNNGGGRRSLLNEPEVKSLNVTLRHEFMPRLRGFLDAKVSKNSGSYANNFVSSSFTLLASAPGNPFDQPVRITTPAFGADQWAATSIEETRLVGGLIFQLPKRWQAELDYTWGKTRSMRVDTSNVLLAGAGTAVSAGATAGGTAFNVFRDTNAYPVDFGQYLQPGPVIQPGHSQFRDLAMRVAGPIGWQLPGGAPTLTALLEHRKESYGDYTTVNGSSITIVYPMSREVQSAYVEATLPVVSASNRLPGIELLELQIAGRRDRYANIGSNISRNVPPDPRVAIERELSSTDPTVGLRFQPIADVMLRASYGTGFLPPRLGQMVPGTVFECDGDVCGITDPRRGGEVLGTFTYKTGGNPELRPEKSESLSAGIILTPRVLPNFRLSADWTRIEKHDNITGFSARQSDLDNELLIPGLVTRGPPSGGYEVGPVLGFNGPLFNVARQIVEAWDFAIGYTRDPAAWGTLGFSAAATRNIQNTTQLLVTLPAFDTLGQAGTLKWSANATVDWTLREWTASWTARFLNSYCLLGSSCLPNSVTLSQGSIAIPSQMYHDVAVGYRFADNAAQWLTGTEVRLGARNVLDKDLPVDVSSVPYYSSVADPRGASYYISFSKKFEL